MHGTTMGHWEGNAHKHVLKQWLSPNSTWLVTSRHDTIWHVRCVESIFASEM